MKWPWTKPAAGSPAPPTTSAQPDPADGFTDGEVRTAALRLPGVFGHEARRSYLGGTVEECDRVLATIADLRTRYADYPSPRMRRAVMRWMDYYDRHARETREECRTQKTMREQEDYRAKRDAENERVSQLQDRLRSIQAP